MGLDGHADEITLMLLNEEVECELFDAEDKLQAVVDDEKRPPLFRVRQTEIGQH